MKSILQNVKTGEISVREIPGPILRRGNVIVENAFSLVSAGTERAVLEFSNSSYLKKARLRPDLFRKVLNRAKNEGLWQTYKIVRELINQEIQLGYSSAGIVREVGEDVENTKAGDRVACAGLFYATHSEVVSVPKNLVVKIPDNVGFEEASFVTLGAIAMQGIRLAQLSLSENVVVYGLGLVGAVAAQMALAAGCRVVGLDIDSEKLALAERLGCEGLLIDEDLETNILHKFGGFGADKVLLCAATKSNEPIERIPGIIRQKGKVIVVGDVPMNIPRRDYYEKEIDIRLSRSYGPGRYDLSYEEGGTDYPYAYVRWSENRNMQSVIDLLSRKRIDFRSLITHRFDVGNALNAYNLIEGKTDESYLGVLISYPGAEKAETGRASGDSGRDLPGAPSGQVRLGIIGAGNFGKAFLLPAFNRQKGAKFQRIATGYGVSAASVGKKYDIPHISSNPDEVINSPDVDAVVISTRHDSHAQYVLAALEAEKAVYVEKPLATTNDELDAIESLYRKKMSEEKKPFLMVGFNRRFSPLAVNLKAAFARKPGPLSMTYRVNAGFVPKTEWVQDPAQGAGRVIGEVCHFIDFLTYLANEHPVELSASALTENGQVQSDTLSITLSFPTGSIGTIHYFANGDGSMPKERIEVFGGGICAELNNFRNLKIYGGRAAGKRRYLNQVKGFEEETAAFVSALQNDRPSPISFAELMSTSRAAIAVQNAIVAGKKVQI